MSEPEHEASTSTSQIRELLAIIGEHTRFLTSTRRRMRRQLAAAGLARCCALVEAMCILREQDRADVIGLLMRAVFEVWLVALYVLLKGDPDDDTVIYEIGADYARYARITEQRVGLPPDVRAALAEWDEVMADARGSDGKPITSRPGFEQIAIALQPLLESVEPGGGMSPREMYDRLYRTESSSSAHPSADLFSQYIAWDPTEECDGIIENPGSRFGGERLGLMFTCHLANRVFKAFGVIVDPRLSAAYEGLRTGDASSKREGCGGGTAI